MGLEARCTARWQDQVSKGKAQLETDELVFLGDVSHAEAQARVLQKGREAGPTDNKVARFSETHTAHKFVRRR